MCLLSYFPPNAPVDTERLACGAECNPHGHGYAIITASGEVLINHAMTPTKLIAEFARLREQHPDSEALFHSRITTHGSTNLANCHPFRVVGPRGGETILAHNGILPSDCQPGRKDNRSDTRILAEEMLWQRWSRFSLPTRGRKQAPVTRKWLDSREVRASIEKWLGTGSKVLVLTTNPRMKQRAYLLNERLGDWVDGVWYSNDSHERWGTRWSSKRRRDWSSSTGWSGGYGNTSYVYRNGEFVPVQNAPVETTAETSWWEEWPTVIGTDKGSLTGERVSGFPTDNGQMWNGREWNPRQSYMHHFRNRVCEVCDSVRIGTKDYICDMCGVCWICNEYYTDCWDEESNGRSCGLNTAIRGTFDETVGFTYRPTLSDDERTEIQQVIDALRSSRSIRAIGAAVVKSAAESAAVFVQEGASDVG
jgi:predicted glutamine amidotransferase